MSSGLVSPWVYLQVMYRKGMLGWWMGDDLSTKKVSRHSVQPRTSVIFPEETGTKYKMGDITGDHGLHRWKIAFPAAVEVRRVASLQLFQTDSKLTACIVEWNLDLYQASIANYEGQFFG